MTGNITKLSGTYLNAQLGTTHPNAAAGTTSFSDFLKSENSSVQNAPVNNADNKNVSADETNFSKKPTGVEKSSVKSKNEDTKTGNQKDVDKAEDMMNEAAGNVYEAVKEVTEVDESAIEEAMSVLGLNLLDLLDAANVKAVFEEVNKIESADLLINEELSTSLSELMGNVDEILNDLLSDLGMSVEEFSAVLDEMKNSEQVDALADLGIAEDMTANAEENVEDDTPQIIVSDLRTNKENVEETVKGEESRNTIETSATDSAVKKSDSKDNSNEQMSFAGNNQQNNFDFTAKVDEAVNLTSYVSESTEEIVSQIVEQIKVNITEETTSMQMQLNPASLGHVGLTIESKAGSITASFVAQNEVVKEAIESQIVELRENIEAQGIKVDAVEVTVAPHEFEQNLEQNQRGDAEEENSKRVQRSGRRIRLNLSEEVEEDELSDEERITKEMMEENGNTVDYTV